MRALGFFAALAAALLGASPALAQSSPNLIFGQVPTAGQWNGYFAAKQDTLGYVPLNSAGGAMTGPLITATPVTVAEFNLPHGAAPAVPNNGDVWTTTSGMFVRINGVTIGPLSGASSSSFAATAPVTLSFPAGVVTYACPTCATTTNGGALTASAPAVISAGGNISITGAAGQVLAGAAPAFTATPTLGASGTPGSLTFGNATSGLLTIQPVTGALGAVTVSIPAATDTLVGKATTDTLTNKTFDTAGAGNVFRINGQAITSNTGTTAVNVLQQGPTINSPTLVTPTINTSATFATGASNNALLQQWSTTTYNALSFNNSVTSTGMIGFFGGASGDSNVYASVPTTGVMVVRVNGAGNVQLGAGVVTLGTNAVVGGSVVLAGATSGSATIKVAAAAGTATNFQIPATNGSNGQLLQTDGSGNTSWITASGTGTVTTLTAGNNISFSSGATCTTACTITLAAPATAHSIVLSEGAAAVLGSINPTTTGRCVVDQGASADPIFAGGCFVLLNTLTASSSASLSDTTSFTSTYNRYWIVFENLIPATNNTNCRLRINSAGVQTTTYLVTSTTFNSNGVGTDVPTDSFPCSRSTSTWASAGTGTVGYFVLPQPSQTATRKLVTATLSVDTTGTGTVVGINVAGYWNGGNGAITGIEVTSSSGNLASGKVYIFGQL